MVRPRPVVQDLLADLPTDAEAAPTQSMLPPKPKRVKKAQPKAKATDAEAEDTVPISKLAESKKSASVSTKRPIMASESADDINVAVALSTALLLPNDLERNAKLSEYENYALMLQHSAQAIQHAHSFSMQSFENRQILAEAATKNQTLALEKAEAAEAVKKVAEAEKREAEAHKVQAQKELQQALATKEAEVKEADEKAYAQGMADVAEDYKLQVRQGAAEAKSLPPAEQVMDLTLDEEGDKVERAPEETAAGQLPSNLLLIERSVESTIAEIDAEIQAEKVAEEIPPESSEVPVTAVADVQES
ncbi:uncharacterized protein LOC114282759 [Camellia sinensis]|uniref:uncharacterized protein LOC114282759 n=1 Tax=Camellia sinensis TaxID=4442 RepID=UPI001036CF72|nr:uncharacterized protein LOC114282759 [Camellia sinensis]